MVKNYNYESEVNELFKTNLKKYYGLNDDWFEFVLFKYFIHYDVKVYEKPKYSDFISFLLKELKIKNQDNYIVYKKTKISFYFQKENSLTNILDEYFMLEKYSFELMKTLLKKAKIYARKENMLPRKESKYKDYRKLFIMNFIEDFYKVNYKEMVMIDGFEYSDDFFNRSIHEYYLWEKDSYNYDVKPYLLTETILENYLYENISKLGDYKPISKQTIIQDGRLDVWVRNKENENVLIECKIVSNPKDLLWQCLNYPTFFEETFNQKIKKMIIVSPLLNKSLVKKITEKIDVPVEFFIYEESFDYKEKKFSFNFRKMEREKDTI